MTKNKLRLTYITLWLITGSLFGIFIAGLYVYFVMIPAGRLADINTFWLIGLVLGFILGAWAGLYFWQKIYIEGARGKKYQVKK